MILRLQQTSHTDSFFFFFSILQNIMPAESGPDDQLASGFLPLLSFQLLPKKHHYYTSKNQLRLLSWIKWVPAWPGLYNFRSLFNSLSNSHQHSANADVIADMTADVKSKIIVSRQHFFANDFFCHFKSSKLLK